jgi:hypothetical protein
VHRLSALLVFGGTALYIDGPVLHPDAQSELLFIFVSLYQLAGAFLLLSVSVAFRLVDMRKKNDKLRT